MPFPEVDRVKYRHNFLDTVICQVRFPPILRIETEVPAAFQERIRSEYSGLSEGQEIVFNLQMGSPLEKEEFKQPISSAVKNYEFASDNGLWKLNLTRNFISLSNKKYVRWEDFRARFRFAFDNFLEVYKPTLFTRIGLRYIDVIARSKVNLGKSEWNELINHELLGVLASPYGNEILQSESAFEIGLEDNESVVRVVTRTVKAGDSGEPCFLIDSDFFNAKRAEKDGVTEKLEYFHARALRLFRWCITDKLHNAMKPETV